MTQIDQHELIQLLGRQSVANVQNGLIHTLAIWMDEHVQGESVRRRKEQPFSAFYGVVRDVARQGGGQRDKWPAYRPLPYPYTQMKFIESLSDQILEHIKGMTFEDGLKFIGELWGGWILVCPQRILRNSPEYANSIMPQTTESGLVDLMLQYLDVVYGNM